MSTKAIVGIIVVIVIVLGGFIYMNRSQKQIISEGYVNQNTPTQVATTTMSQQRQLDTSDNSINKDTASIDAQMTALNSDSGSADSSLSNQNK